MEKIENWTLKRDISVRISDNIEMSSMGRSWKRKNQDVTQRPFAKELHSD